MVELGSGVSMQAEVTDVSRLCIKIGLGFHLESTWDEALNICSLRHESLTTALAEASQRVDQIKAHVLTVRQGLKDLARLAG